MVLKSISPHLQLGSGNTVSSGEIVICVDVVAAKTLEKQLLSEMEWSFEIWEKNPCGFLAFSEHGFVIGDTEVNRAAMNPRK